MGDDVSALWLALTRRSSYGKVHSSRLLLKMGSKLWTSASPRSSSVLTDFSASQAFFLKVVLGFVLLDDRGFHLLHLRFPSELSNGRKLVSAFDFCFPFTTVVLMFYCMAFSVSTVSCNFF